MILELLLALVVAQPNASNAVAELTQIEQRLASTWKQGDGAGWSAMIAPDGLRGTRETAPRSRVQSVSLGAVSRLRCDRAPPVGRARQSKRSSGFDKSGDDHRHPIKGCPTPR